MFEVIPILAAALSLVSTNDYVLTHPVVATNAIIGLGMGKTGDYSIVRAEDRAFLAEAWRERKDAVTEYRSGLLPTNAFSTVGGRPNFTDDDFLASLFQESYTNEYWYLSRGNNNSFVNSGFRMASGSYTPHLCTGDWKITIPDPDGGEGSRTFDIRESYLPFVGSFGTRYLPGGELKTNSSTRALSLAVITNAYHNLDLCGRIVALYDGEPANRNVVPYPQTVRAHYTRDLRNIHYGFTQSSNEYGSWISGYDGTSTDYYETPRTEDIYLSNLPPWTIRAKEQKEYTAYIGWRHPEHGVAEPVILPSKLTRDGEKTSYALATYGIYVYSDLITSDVEQLVSDVRGYLVLCYRYTATRKEWSKYLQADERTETTNLCCYVYRDAYISKSTSPQYHVHDGVTNVVYRTGSVNLGDVFDFCRDEVGWSARTIYPDTSDVPPRLTLPASTPDGVSGHSEVEHALTLEGVHVIYTFNRDYRAKVLEGENQ